MHKRSRSEYDPYIRRFAEIYVKNNKNSAAAAREVRKRFPTFRRFKDTQMASWMRQGTHGFPEEVEAAERRAVTEMATDVRKWLNAEIQDLADRERQYKEQEKELLDNSEATKAIQIGYLINGISREIEVKHRFVKLLDKADEDGAGIETYREIIRECQKLSAKRKSA